MTTSELEYWTETFIKESLKATLLSRDVTGTTHVLYRILKCGQKYQCLAFTTGEFQVTSEYLSTKHHLMYLFIYVPNSNLLLGKVK